MFASFCTSVSAKRSFCLRTRFPAAHFYIKVDTDLANHVDATVALARDVTEGLRPRPDFVVWPENSTAVDPFEDASTNAQIETAVAAIGGAPVALALPIRNGFVTILGLMLGSSFTADLLTQLDQWASGMVLWAHPHESGCGSSVVEG